MRICSEQANVLHPKMRMMLRSIRMCVRQTLRKGSRWMFSKCYYPHPPAPSDRQADRFKYIPCPRESKPASPSYLRVCHESNLSLGRRRARSAWFPPWPRPKANSVCHLGDFLVDNLNCSGVGSKITARSCFESQRLCLKYCHRQCQTFDAFLTA